MDKVLVIGIVGESVFMKCDHFHKPGETINFTPQAIASLA